LSIDLFAVCLLNLRLFLVHRVPVGDKVVAIKKVHCGGDFEKELAMMQQLNSPYLVGYSL
jgi:hypothetical protein